MYIIYTGCYIWLMQDTRPNKPVNKTKVKTIHTRVNEPCAWRSMHVGKSVLDVTDCICCYCSKPKPSAENRKKDLTARSPSQYRG